MYFFLLLWTAISNWVLFSMMFSKLQLIVVRKKNMSNLYRGHPVQTKTVFFIQLWILQSSRIGILECFFMWWRLPGVWDLLWYHSPDGPCDANYWMYLQCVTGKYANVHRTSVTSDLCFLPLIPWHESTYMKPTILMCVLRTWSKTYWEPLNKSSFLSPVFASIVSVQADWSFTGWARRHVTNSFPMTLLCQNKSNCYVICRNTFFKWLFK